MSCVFLNSSDVSFVFLSMELCNLDGSIEKQFLYPFRGSVYENAHWDNIRVQVCGKNSYLVSCDISAAFWKFYDKSAVIWFCLIYIGNVFRAFQTADLDFGSLL